MKHRIKAGTIQHDTHSDLAVIDRLVYINYLHDRYDGRRRTIRSVLAVGIAYYHNATMKTGGKPMHGFWHPNSVAPHAWVSRRSR